MTISTNINEQKTVFVPITSISTDIKKMQPILHLTVITNPPPPPTMEYPLCRYKEYTCTKVFLTLRLYLQMNNFWSIRSFHAPAHIELVTK